jgi:hypothetical protein
VGNPTDAAMERLAAEWRAWEFWVVKRVCGGPLYCCRRHDDHGQGLRAGSPALLAEALEQATDHGWVSGTCGHPDDEIPRLTADGAAAQLRELHPGWTIGRNELLGVWTAEQTDGTEVRFLVAPEAWELEAKIRKAEPARLRVVKEES